MLYRLEIENFYSVRDRQVIDVRLSQKVKQNPERFAAVFPDSRDRVPKVVAIFGANGAGKTNCLRALAFLAWFIRDSFQLTPEAQIPLQQFGAYDSLSHETRLAFSLGGPTDLDEPNGSYKSFGTYQYELVIRRTDERNHVVRESLRHKIDGSGKSFRVFERNQFGEVRDGENFSLAHFRPAINRIRSNASVISTLAQFNHSPSIGLRNAALTVITNIFIIKQDYTDDQLHAVFTNDPALRESLNREIPRADLGIRSLQVVPGNPNPVVQFHHEGLDFPVPWVLESHGTQSFVRSFPIIASAMKNGGLAVIDELDASLHPLMLVEIIRWFYDPSRNSKNAMLWFTCQNASILEELSKEEVVFCEKDYTGRSLIYGLQDIENVRRVDNYYRKYLSGVYGALPAFG